MPSIVLSFVGSQDPVSKNTEEEGSIVSLLRELKKQSILVKKAILLFTEGTKQNAIDTQEWLASESELQNIEIELVAVSAELSYDPTDLLKAAQEAKQGLELVKQQLQKGDRIEFNASSGTPAMKSAFSMLQAAGYATNGTVWQVRNPKEMKEDQSRVFQTDVSSLRKEFDLKVLRQFIAEYNYSAALDLLENSELDVEPKIKIWIQACCDWNQGKFTTFFKKMKSSLTPEQNRRADVWWSRSYEQAFTAIVRFRQGNTTEAMQHSFRAIEGSFYEWAIAKFPDDIQKRKNKLPLVKKSILQKLPQLESRYEEEKNRNRNNEVLFQGWFLQDILESTILEIKNSEDFKIYWKSAKDARNFVAHQLGGVTEKQLFDAWQIQSQKLSDLEKRLLNCLSILTGQPFNSLEDASLFSNVHKEIQKQLENYQV